MNIKTTFFISLLSCPFLTNCALLKKVRPLKQYNTSWQQNETSSSKTSPHLFVDVVIIHVEGSTIDWKDLKKQFQVAHKTFKRQGVMLNLIKAIKVKTPRHWHKINIDEVNGTQETGLDFYKTIEKKKKKLSKKATKHFSHLIQDFENKDRTIFLLTLNEISMGILEKNEGRDTYRVKNFKVGGYSFPSYIYQDRIPSHLRGVITLGRKSKTNSIMAHELAHKLINASHEGGSSCPKFSGTKIPGILGYTGSTQILSGVEGRFHGERLRKSPFVYQIKNDKKVWNTDYQKDGVYSDPIYGKYIMTPVCP